jgi:hypothetical protein
MGTGSYVVRADGGPVDGLKALIRAIITTHGCSKVMLRWGAGARRVVLPAGPWSSQLWQHPFNLLPMLT